MKFPEFDDQQWRRPAITAGFVMWLTSVATLFAPRIRTPLPAGILATGVVLLIICGLLSAIGFARHRRIYGRFSYRWLLMTCSFAVAFLLLGTALPQLGR